MHAPSVITPFELSGRFGGFVFTPEGKRRMLLHQDGETCLLKVPRLLRRRLVGQLLPGAPLRVAGTEAFDPGTGVRKRVVSRVLPDEAPPHLVDSADALPPAVFCPVRVCSKKNCWRQGGCELWDALVREREARGLAGQVELRQTGCLDRCKQAPNADVGRGEFSRCAPRDAAALLDRAAGLPAGPDR